MNESSEHMPDEQLVKDRLESLNISYEEFEHPPVFTCEESEKLCPPMPGKKNKNLFFRDRKGKQYYLISLAQDKRLSIDEFGEAIGISKLSFASERRLKSTLGVEPGSVGILALINDSEKLTQVFIDQDLLKDDWFQSHPLINTSTISFSTRGLGDFLKSTGHEMTPVDLS